MPSGIPAHARTPAGVRRVAAFAATFLFAAALTGCDRVKSLVGRGGANLSLPIATGQSSAYRSLIEAPGAEGGTGTRIELSLTCKAMSEEGESWFAFEGEISGGRYEVNGAPRQVALAGQKAAFKYNALRKVSSWRGLDFPTGLELLDLSPPKGRVKKGESWKTDARRWLVNFQEEVEFTRTFILEGEVALAGESAWRMSVRIQPGRKTLGAGGAVLEYSGTGEVWIARKDGRLLKATEVLEGTIRDEKSGKPPARFVQAMTLADAATAPTPLASLASPAVAGAGAAPVAVPAPGGAASAPARPGVPAAGGGPAAPRLSFVNRSTGRREVWSVLPDGSAKLCLTPLEYEHWNHVPDPDGRILAAVSSRPGGVNIWSINLVSGEQVALTELSERDAIATGWAAGGSRLVFVRAGKLWSIQRDGFNMSSYPLTGRVVEIATTPKSSMVAVVVNELNQNKIFTVDIQSGVIHELLEGEGPAFSPDGQKIAYRTADALFVVNSDGSGSLQLVKGQFGEGPLFWHPEAKINRIGCTQSVVGVTDVYMVDATPGAKPVRVTTRGGTGMTFSPAGDRIAYLRHGDLWLASADGKVHAQLTADGATEGPVWWMAHHVP